MSDIKSKHIMGGRSGERKTRAVEVNGSLADMMNRLSIPKEPKGKGKSRKEKLEDAKMADKEHLENTKLAKYLKTKNGAPIQVEQDVMVKVTKVLDHEEKAGEYMFKLRYTDGTVKWVDDADCDCETLIRAYLEVKTMYLICRVSSKSQLGPTHVSIEVQEAQLRELAKKYLGYRVKVVKISASAYKNVPFQLIEIGNIAKEGDAVFVYRVDRLSRNIALFLAFLSGLSQKKVSVYAMSENLWYCDFINKKKETQQDNEAFRFIQHVMDAQRESLNISTRVRDSVEKRVSRGDQALGNVKYGLMTGREDKTNKILVLPNQEEQNMIGLVNDQYEELRVVIGTKVGRCRSIAEDLNSKGVMKRGKVWTASGVMSLLK